MCGVCVCVCVYIYTYILQQFIVVTISFGGLVSDLMRYNSETTHISVIDQLYDNE